MGGCGSKNDAAEPKAQEQQAAAPAAKKEEAPPADDRRAKQAEKRRQSQNKLRPQDPEKQAKLKEAFENNTDQWPSRPPWYRKGKHTQGINIMLADPEPLRGEYFTVIARGQKEYSITVGYGKETKFDASAMRLSICCSTVSMKHCMLHFSREGKHSQVTIEDLNSLNGTFIMGRPEASSPKRPMLEREVRETKWPLQSVDYVRLGSACVLVMDATNIYWDDEEDEEDDEVDPVEGDGEDLVPKMLEEGWYFPMPCPPKLAEIAMKKRNVADDESDKGKQKLAVAV